ncbi:MAG: hypothetical protein KDD47_06700 [Acidobacteria bacterium]|nr:hypothetical protein [Acidobacteriota bacterium]
MTAILEFSARFPLRAAAVFGLCLALCTGSAWGQAAPRPSVKGPALALHAHIFENQPAVEALSLVYPLLSDAGTVELKPKENTLVIRDTLASIHRIVPVLSRFDHPQRQIQLEVRIVSARAETFSPPNRSPLPKEHVERLRDMLPYHSYEQLAGTLLEAGEGARVNYQLGNRFSLDFRLGTLVEGARVRLHEFQVFRGATAGSGEKKRLIVTTLFLHLNQPVYLGLAPSEDSKEALMVVVTARLPEPATGEGQRARTAGGGKP